MVHRHVLFPWLALVASSVSALRPPARVSRRAVACGLASASLIAGAAPAAAAQSRTDGYAVQRSEREWAYVLSGEQYYILRQGGTEQPNILFQSL